MSNQLLDAALSYASRRWLVFPVKPKDKRPLTKNGLKDATTDHKQIRKWWSQWPDANIGIKTGKESGLWVLDIDGDTGKESFARLIKDHGDLPATLAVATGKRLYFYFSYPPDAKISNRAGKIAPGIDVRGDGGYVIAPPSVHPSGREYRWEVLP